MSNKKTYSATFKAKVAMAALSNYKSTSELASEFQVHPARISSWKKMATEGLIQIFESNKKSSCNDPLEKEKLYEEIGRLKVQLDWIKKKSGFDI